MLHCTALHCTALHCTTALQPGGGVRCQSTVLRHAYRSTALPASLAVTAEGGKTDAIRRANDWSASSIALRRSVLLLLLLLLAHRRCLRYAGVRALGDRVPNKVDATECLEMEPQKPRALANIFRLAVGIFSFACYKSALCSLLSV